MPAETPSHVSEKKKNSNPIRIYKTNLTFSTRSVRRKTQSKKFYTYFSNPSRRSTHHKTHAHTPTHPYQAPHSSIIQQRRRCLGYLSLLLLAASQRGALLAPLAGSVYHTTAVARVIDAILPTTATPGVALAALG